LQLLFVLLGTVCAAANLAAQSYEEGRAAYLKGDYQAAYEILRPLADSGDPEAQKMLGIMYDYGHGVEVDQQQALNWYIRSAEQGQPAVQYQVGAKYFKGDGIPQDHAEAVRWWTMAADNGQVEAQFNLGLMYFRGLGANQNDLQAAELFLKAAEQEHGYAQYSIAVMYAFGRGVDKNYDLALQWFLKSADKGIAQAQFNLGIFYENGYAVARDYQRAMDWYERAAAQGLTEASTRLEKIRMEQSLATRPSAGVDTVSSTSPVREITHPPDAELAADPVAEISSTGIRREDWVRQQREDSYTIQIGSVTDEDDLVNFIRSHNLEGDTAYIRVVIDGVTRYNALYGNFNTYAEAEQAAAGLPEDIRRVSPWIRNIGILQKLLN
jgi:TPR repeat protein